MTATVIYPKNAAFEILIEGKDDSYIDEMLSEVWNQTQGGVKDVTGKDSQLDKRRAAGESLRSSMVGDVFVVMGRYFVVDRMGFAEITKEQLENYLAVPNDDLIMGWDWVRKHSNVGMHLALIR